MNYQNYLMLNLLWMKRENFMEENHLKKIPIIRRKDGGFLSSYSDKQTNLDYY